VAPSSPFKREHLDEGIDVMRRMGIDVVDTSEQVLREGHPFLNGSDDERVASLIDALTDDVDVVWLARGGYGLTRIMRPLRERLVEHRSHFESNGLPTIVGFSDATALFGLLATLDMPAVHGPLATSLRNEPDDSVEHLRQMLQGDVHQELACIPRAGRVDEVQAPLFVANLCVLTALVGTDAMPDLNGRILVVEEIGERPYRIDRMLAQLTDAGALDGVVALCTGHLTGCDERKEQEVTETAHARFAEWSARLGLPWFSDLPVGHEAPNFALLQGSSAQLKLQGSRATLAVTVDG